MAVRADRDIGEGRHLILSDIDGDHRLWLCGRAEAPQAIILPLDGDFELRLAAAARYVRRLRGERSGPPAPRLGVTAFQRARLILLIAISDLLSDGRTKREIARGLVYPGLEIGSAAEWKSSAERRRTQRLCDEAKAMVAAGYRWLLRGH